MVGNSLQAAPDLFIDLIVVKKVATKQTWIAACTPQLNKLRQNLVKFNKAAPTIMNIAMDNQWSHEANNFAMDNNDYEKAFESAFDDGDGESLEFT